MPPKKSAAGSAASPTGTTAGSPPNDSPISSATSSPAPGASGSSSSQRGAKKQTLTRKPMNVSRRAKEERLQAEKEREARRKAEADENEAKRRQSSRGRGGRGRGDRGGRGRGGFAGDRGLSQGASGPFSLAAAQDVGHYGPHIQRRLAVRSSHSSTPRPKREGTVKTELNDDGTPVAVPYDDDYSSSDPEGDFEEKVDIDDINLLGEEEMGTISRSWSVSESRSKSTGPENRRLNTGLAPVRIKRREHVDRVVGVNTDTKATSDAATLIDKSTGQAATLGTSGTGNKKGRTKASDLAVPGTEVEFKGVWRDEEDMVPVKPEPVDKDDVIMGDMTSTSNVPASVATGAGYSQHDTSKVVKDTPSSPEQTKRKPKVKKSGGPRDPPYSLETEEDKQEWARHLQAMDIVAEELGNTDINPATDAKPTTEATTEGEGTAQADISAEADMPDASTAADSARHDKKADRVYLFQFPPSLPPLVPVEEGAKVKAEPDSPVLLSSNPAIPDIPANAAPLDAPIKLEDESKDKAKILAGADAGEEKRQTDLPMPAGYIGKLRVHASGAAYLDYGGIPMKVKLGIPAHFLQTAVAMKIDPDGGEETPRPGAGGSRYQGEAWSFGNIYQKFVVSPDLDSLTKL